MSDTQQTKSHVGALGRGSLANELARELAAAQARIAELERQLEASRELSSKRRHELRRLNAQIKYLWCSWRAGLLASDVTRLRGAMNATFGPDAVRAAEHAAIDAARETK
jgi:hypothetical protein